MAKLGRSDDFYELSKTNIRTATMNPLFFKETNSFFDPNRARLNLRCGRQISIVAGVETGQLVGNFGTLEAVGKYSTESGSRSMMISNYLMNGPGHGDNGKIVF